MDRPLLIAFGISLACHLIALGVTTIRLRRQLTDAQASALEVIYESRLAEQELNRLKQQLSELSGRPSVSQDVQAPTPRIRIPDRPPMTLPAALLGPMMSRASIIDLTNLVDASQGNPVFLSYFSAIRERIQRTANQQAWLASEDDTGLIYVSFILNATGQAQGVAIVPDRSSPSAPLQQIALKIIKAASPFAPFPPSLAESSKTVVVPLEFLLSP